jgi:PRTRC genetic system protein B
MEINPHEDFTARSALVEYRSKDKEKVFIMRHDVLKGRLSEGTPVTRQALMDLCTAVIPEMNSGVGFIPPEVLSFTPGNELGMVLWWSPAQVRHMYFYKNTGIPSGPAPVPASLFMVKSGGLYTWAMDTDERPGPSTRLYHTPFFNSNGDVCLGNVKGPGIASPDSIKKWESTYWRSAFTDEAPPMLKDIEGEKLWKSLVNSGRKKFPVKYLNPTGTTVKKILEDA